LCGQVGRTNILKGVKIDKINVLMKHTISSASRSGIEFATDLTKYSASGLSICVAPQACIMVNRIEGFSSEVHEEWMT
jgi:hypothetical protein